VEVTGGMPGPTPADALGRLTRILGHAVAWLLLALVGMIFVIVLLRYGLNLGWIWLQETTVYVHAAIFMLAAAWTLQEDGHVRVDIFYRRRSARYRAWVNLLGTVFFLVPFCVYMLVIGWDYVLPSWRNLEASREAGGLPLVFVLKSLLLLMPATLLLQAVSSLRMHIAECRKT
jgi:TRAP-type mannitol/chloroaromatic compound transport system permease small subunit